MAAIEARDRTTILIHYYRAMVGRADIWRMRMDATTNWAIGATAAVLTFALGSEAVPHFVVFFGSLLTLGFLLLEARRLTFYHLWQRRVLLLERGLVRPALQSEGVVGGSDPAGFEATLNAQLGTTVPTMSIPKAAARRLRRVYLYLFSVQLLAWLFKLSNHPEPVSTFLELAPRAQIGPLPGAVLLGTSAVAFACAAALALARGGVDVRSVD